MNYLLSVKDLIIRFNTNDGWITAVDRLSFNLTAKETLGIVGESGSGKSQTGFAIMGLLAKNAQVSGSILFSGQELLDLTEQQMNQYRSKRIALIFQDPMTSLNPYMKIGNQLTEVLRFHENMSQTQAIAESIRMLDAVKIPLAKQRMNLYPHELSGGMRQRVVIAMSLLCRPELLIADEPTTAIDVTVQSQIIELFKQIQQEFNTAILFISHDLGVVASLCDNILVMRSGTEVEYGSKEEIYLHPRQTYTQDLLNAIPRLPPETFGLKSAKISRK